MPVTASTRPPVTTRAVGAAPRRRRVGTRFVAQAGDRRAEHGRVGVAGRGGHHGEGRAVAHLDGRRVELAAAAGQRQLGEIGVEQRQDRLRLGVAEAAVELEQLRSVGGQHQPGVQHADVRRAAGGEVVDDRLDELCRQRVGVVRRSGAGA